MPNFTKYRLELVKEETNRYAMDKNYKSPKDCVDLVNALYHLSNLPDEKMVMLCMDVKLKVIGAFEVSSGTLNSSLVHPREILKRAITCNAYAIILFHNHPSDTCDESKEDVQITRRMKDACNLIGISLLDHIIVTCNSYNSLKEKGVI